MALSAARKVRDPIALWRWLRSFTLLYLALKLCGAIVFVLSHYFVAHRALGDSVAWGDGAYALASPPIYLVCLILTCRLTYRLMKNLHQLGSAQVEISPGWAVGYYFVLIANLIMPPRVAGEIWRGTFWHEAQPRLPNGIIALWWTVTLITIATSIVASSGATEAGNFMLQVNFNVNPAQMSPLAAASSVLAGLSAMLFLNVFGRITHGQHNLIKVAAF